MNKINVTAFISATILLFCLALAAFAAWAGTQPARAAFQERAPGAPADGTESLPPGVIVQTVLSNIANPVAMAFDPQGRLFYTEKETGRVRPFANNALQASPGITYSVD